MRLLLFISISFLFLGCEDLVKDVEVPAYIKIDQFDLTTDETTQGTEDHDLSDAWVYIDDELVGHYELPITFPVIVSPGNHKVMVSPGVRMNGISATRYNYNLMTSHIENRELFVGDTVEINPSVTYRENAVFKWLEDFEDGGDSWVKGEASDTNMAQLFEDSLVITGDGVGQIYMTDEMSFFEVKTDVQFELPKDGSPVFLEVDHRSLTTSDDPDNRILAIGLIAYKASSIVQTDPVIWLNSKDDWNKTYVNLTAAVLEHQDAFVYQLYFGVVKTEGSGDYHTLLDNIKLVHL